MISDIRIVDYSPGRLCVYYDVQEVFASKDRFRAAGLLDRLPKRCAKVRHIRQ